ncbi:LysR family transcriptional regulator [Bradyrhizobium liaoningense]
MLDTVTINQLRTFIAVCDEASFSGASRRLMRAQSAVSHAIAALEEALGVCLFSREGHKPELTAAGRLLLADARAVLANTETLKNRAKSIAEAGVSELVIGVDPHFPRRPLAAALAELEAEAPTLNVKLFGQMSARGEKLVLERRLTLAIVVAPSPIVDANALVRRLICEVPFVTVCAPSHPLSGIAAPICAVELQRHTQLAVSDPETDVEGLPTCAIGERTWFVGDLAAAHEFLLAGLGWAHMPLELVSSDLAARRLVELDAGPRGGGPVPLVFAMSSLRGRNYSESEEQLVRKLGDARAPRA